MKIITTGRTDLKEYFAEMTSWKKLNHTPYIVFLPANTGKRKILEGLQKSYASKEGRERMQLTVTKGINTQEEIDNFYKREAEEIKQLQEEIEPTKNDMQVYIIDNIEDLLDCPDDTPVMGQWSGKWRSDFFQFTVKDIRNFLLEKDEKISLR